MKNAIKRASNKKIFIILFSVIIIVILSSIFYWKYNNNKYTEEKNIFTEQVKDLSSDNYILIVYFLTLNAGDTESSKYSG